MKKIVNLLILAVLTSAATAQPLFEATSSYGVTAQSSCGTLSPPCPAGGFYITNMKACHDEQITLTVKNLPLDYQYHTFEFTDLFNPNNVITVGIFMNAAPINITLPAGTYAGKLTVWADGKRMTSGNLHVVVIPTPAQNPTLSSGPYCAGQDISVISEDIISMYGPAPAGATDFTDISVDMGDGTTYSNYTVSPNQGGVNGTNVVVRIDENHQYNQPGTYDITTTYTYQCGPRSNSISIVVGPSPSFNNEDLICENHQFTFSNTTNCLGSIDLGSLTWVFGDGNSSNDENPTHVYNATGNYNVTLSFQVNGINYSVSNMVSVTSSPQVDLGPDLVFCSNQLFGFPQLDGTEGITYTWSFNGEVLDDENDRYLQAFSFGQYCVTTTNEAGCAGSDCISIIENPSFEPMNPNFTFFPVGQWCQPYVLNVTATETRVGISHQYYVYTGTIHGQSNGSQPVAGPLAPNANGNLSYQFQPDIHYYVKHGVYSYCDTWVAEDNFFTYTCAQLVGGSNGFISNLSSDRIKGSVTKNNNIVNESNSSLTKISNNINVYPNPTNDVFNINGLSIPAQIIVMSLEGKIVLKEQFIPSSESLYSANLSSFKSGIYIVQITDENQKRSFLKIIKE
jgi:PKD repeat protein